MRRLTFSLLLIVLLHFPYLSHATHIVGGEMSYEWLGGESYIIRLSIYSDCGSEIVLDPQYEIGYFSESLGIGTNEPEALVLVRTRDPIDVSFTCGGVVSNCQLGGQPEVRGINRYDYASIINLSSLGKARDWVFFWRRPARSESITTLVFPDGQDYYTQLTLNNLDVSGNSSPVFTSNPILNVCQSDTVTLSNVVTDKEGDELRFKLIAPKVSFDQEVTYIEGTNFINFLGAGTNAVVNPTTGDLRFVTNNLSAIGITDILMEEYRNGILISSITRGIEITVEECNNIDPVITNFLGEMREDLGDSVSICLGDSISVAFEAFDPDGDNVEFDLLGGRQNVFFAPNTPARNPVGRFSFRATPNMIGVNRFTVRANDGRCPEPGATTKTFIINVLSKPEIILPASQKVKLHVVSIRIKSIKNYTDRITLTN